MKMPQAYTAQNQDQGSKLREEMAQLRAARAEKAKKHIATMSIVFADKTKESIKNATVYKEGQARKLDIPEARFEKTAAHTVHQSSVEALMSIDGENVAVLDFASFTNPGGGYERGVLAQEEALCSESNLYPILDGCRKIFYDDNKSMRRGGLYTDKSMYVPGVVFGEGNNLKTAGVIVCAAPNKRQALENGRDEIEIEHDLARRVEAVMRIAAVQGVDSLVLGAFGCGVFRNGPNYVVELFKNWLDEHPGVFANVAFAIPGGANFKIFSDVFPEPQKEKQISQAQKDEQDAKDEEKENEDWQQYASSVPSADEDGLDEGSAEEFSKKDWRYKLAQFKNSN